MALPNGYTQLRYIQGSGTQYIDTGFKPNQDTRVVADMYFPEQTAPKAVFGGRNGDTTNVDSFVFWMISTSSFRSDFGSDGQAIAINPVGRFLIDKNKTTTSVNGSEYVSPAASFQSDYNLALFTSLDVGGNDKRIVSGNLYFCKIYDNGTLVRDFVPAMNSDGTVGLYDTANGVFYTNAGAGTFTAGPLATGPVDGEGATILAGVSFAIKEGTAMLNGVARKITEGMTILGGAAKKIAVASGIDVAAMVIGYTGAFSDQKDVVMSGKTYRLLTLTGSGTLTVPEEVTADVWMCAGGSGGGSGFDGSYNFGGAGGYVAEADEIKVSGSVVCVIGAGSAGMGVTTIGSSGSTSFGSICSAAGVAGKDGGSGGGGGITAGTGAGKSTVPFLDTSEFDPHSAGGGGGGYRDMEDSVEYKGGAGGSNGSKGNGRKSGGYSGGAGGNKGGGAGGKSGSSTSNVMGSDATFYGSGGGGGAVYWSGDGEKNYDYGGDGYQGVIYVRIPYEQ